MDRELKGREWETDRENEVKGYKEKRLGELQRERLCAYLNMRERERERENILVGLRQAGGVRWRKMALTTLCVVLG